MNRPCGRSKGVFIAEIHYLDGNFDQGERTIDMNKFIKGFYYACKGVNYAFRTQVNFRVELLAALLVTVISYYLEISTTEWLWIISAISIVLIAELANTAIETLVDMVSPDYNPKAGIVKDLSSAAVLISSFLALMIGILILLPKLIDAS